MPRSSVIVSDEPLSRETNYRTEFVAVLNNQPQGGFLMRRPTVGVPVASGNYRGNELRLLFPAQLELPTSEHASARGPILSTDATAVVVVRPGTPRRRVSQRR
jgi:hypothetical protein